MKLCHINHSGPVFLRHSVFCTPALLPLLTGSARRVVHGEIGCSNWKKTPAYLLVLPGSRARIVRCGGRYGPQLVKRSSE